MGPIRASLFLAAAAALAACGASSNSAPIVYGTSPSSSPRVYNTPADVYLSRAETESARPAEPVYDSYAQPAVDPGPIAPLVSTPLPPAQGASSVAYGAPQDLTPQRVLVSANDPVAAPPAPGTTSAWADGARIVVQPGDTVYAISRRTGAGPQAIIGANGLRAPYMLNVGQVLTVPSVREKVVNTVAAPRAETRPAAARYTQPAYVPPAPPPSTAAPTGVYVVRPGDTLYSIARATGLPVSGVARANGLEPPFTLAVGQRLAVPAAGQTVVAAPAPQPTVRTQTVSYANPAPAMQSRASLFDWPVKGAVIGRYGMGGLGRRNEGVNIAAPVGTPVRAAADGEVVYRGNEVDGYGNLLLIKHADDFVTAYAHNDVLLVRKGQRVTKGQIIAKVGQTGDAVEPQLHFEIRQNLKSIDPLAMLDAQ
ncbi:MAG: peptidoglycan DD-metalloendopeptidase family protein [Pseudomonadota bacterium]